jgi:HEAT repeat protein
MRNRPRADSQGMESSDERLKSIFRARASADIPALVDSLHDPEHASVAARSLRKRADAVTTERDPAIRGLRRLLKARDPHARASAASALGELRACEAADELTEIACHDSVQWVRQWAVAALGKATNENSYAVIVAALDDQHYRMRRTAVVTLSAVGNPEAVLPLTQAMRRERWHRRSPYRLAIRELTRPTP